ncbi:uncharacterized protein LOC116290862 [Actinia tenebrosa]|uniref:Uncharacterized protein LOC116290862 n=1 Tax=Actinia tenebrosa TaxID=6105 RepID=A0A6P8HDS7_ACTTE|nr:uncharacterized protein LOC116290862 [Actinia tenebrosa]
MSAREKKEKSDSKKKAPTGAEKSLTQHRERKLTAKKRKIPTISSSSDDSLDDDCMSAREKREKSKGNKKETGAKKKPIKSLTSQKALMDENADKQSMDIEKERQKSLTVKVNKIHGHETIEFTVNVKSDITVEELKKKLSGTTGIPEEEIILMIRGESCRDLHVKIKEIWSPQDIIGVIRSTDPDVTSVKSDTSFDGTQFDDDNWIGKEEYPSTEFDGTSLDANKTDIESQVKNFSSGDFATKEEIMLISKEIKEMQQQLYKMEHLLRGFASCKQCVKRFYKNAKEDNSTGSVVKSLHTQFQPPLTPDHHQSPAAHADHQSPIPEHSIITTTSCKAASSGLPESDAKPDLVMLGNPKHGICVNKDTLSKISNTKAKNYALKLFEVLFSREEAAIIIIKTLFQQGSPFSN